MIKIITLILLVAIFTWLHTVNFVTANDEWVSGAELTEYECSYASARILWWLYGDGAQLKGWNWQFKWKWNLQRKLTDHLEKILQTSDINYISNFNNNTWKDGIAQSTDDWKTIKWMKLEGLEQDIFLGTSIVNNNNARCDLEAFMAGIIETEWSQAWKIFDWWIWKRLILKEVLEEIGFTTARLSGSRWGGFLTVDASEFSKFSSFPFVFCARVPGGTKFCNTNIASKKDLVLSEMTEESINQAPSSIGVSRWRIAENNTKNAVVARVTVEDPDDNTNFRFANSSCLKPWADDDFFKVANFWSAWAQLRTNNLSRIDWSIIPAFDYENPMDANGDNIYEICFTVFDSQGASLEKRVWIRILNTQK